MAAVDITCPHCNRAQKVAEHRLTETVYCLLCQQLITDVYLYKIAPKQAELTIKLKGRIVSEFGTTKLEDLKSKSDEYTGRFEPVSDEDTDEVNQVDETTRIFDTGTYRSAPVRKKLSTAARTYLLGGLIVAVLAAGVTIIGVTMLSDDVKTKEIESTGADGMRLERYSSGAKKAQWRVVDTGGAELIEGEWREWHEDGTDKMIGNYAQGEKVGAWRAWHANGQLALEGTYSAGKQDGPWKEWHANANKAVEGTYIKGDKLGKWRTWHKSGLYATLEEYDAGLPLGDWVSWYEDGTVRTQATYVNGQHQGEATAFHDNGTVELFELWKGGVLDGQSHGGYRNLQKSFEGNWLKGVRDGPWLWWHQNGNQQRQALYVDAVENGQWSEWYPTGVLRLTGEYANGRRTGLWQEFDEAGDLTCKREYQEGAETSQTWFFRGVQVQRRTEMFQDGSVREEWSAITGQDGIELRHGYQRTYYSTGVLAESGAWVKGLREGPWRTFDASGNLLSEERWANGNKVE